MMTIQAILSFFAYLGAGLVFLCAFAFLYVKITPYDEVQDIRAGKKAPAIALGGALLGFTFPILSLSYHGINLFDFSIWSLVAGVVQVILFKVLYAIMPMKEISADNQAVAIAYAFAAVCTGLVNAFSLIPQ